MLIVQHNCGRGYESTITTLETALSIGAGIVMLQEPFIGSREICHSAFNFYWPQTGQRNEMRVMTTIKKDVMNKAVIDHRTDLVNHPYFMVFEMREIDLRSKKPGKKTRIVNVYNNRVGQGCTWEGENREVRQALEDVNWDRIFCGRVLFAGDINAHSPLWNPHC